MLTAPEVAKAHFARELERLEQNDEAETLVVLHDACYGHRFARPKTSRSSLSMIVERPERLHAGVLGAATAFVRMGGHHQEGAHPPHNAKTLEGPPPFKIRRTSRAMDITSQCVTNVHGTAWMGELKTMSQQAGEKLAKMEKELTRPASPSGREKRELHQGDLYLCSESLNAFQGALGGVADAVDAVFSPTTRTQRSFVAVRPPGHHCSADFPSGFCWLNNVHVGLEYAAQTHGLTHAAIIDFDLHHGDGSQAIAWQRNGKNNEKRVNAKPTSKLKLGPDIGYYSLHDINSYPCEMGDDEKVQAASLCVENAHSQSVWNVHLQPWKTEDEFWQLYETRYRVLLDKAKVFLQHHTSRLRREGKVRPKAALFISAGFDASEWEGEGMQRHKVNVPTEFYARFTRDMVQLAQEEGTGCDGRVISVLEGGYSDRALCSGVLSHLSGLCIPSKSPQSGGQMNGHSGLGASMTGTNGAFAFDLDEHMNSLSIDNHDTTEGYDKTWWSAENLTALEMKVNPPPPPAQGKKIRTGPQPTYATPTESFAYKVVDPNKFARSISGTFRDIPTGEVRRPQTPPLPDVDWIIATQELSKLLIPQDRQTKSCTPEELAGPKTVKSFAPTMAQREEAEKPRQLRTRAAKPAGPDGLESLRVQSRADRRRTIADLPMSNDPTPPVQQRRSSRRSSMASTLSSEAFAQDVDVPPMPPPPAPDMANGDMKPPPVPTGPPSGVQVKKTRAPPKLKRAPTPSSAPVSPAHNARSSVSPAPPTYNVPTMPAQTVGLDTQPHSAGPSQASDMDSLTSGMKKVTLKVGTREDHDRKQKEKQDAANKTRALKAAETRRVNAAAKKAAAAAATAQPAANNPPALTAAQRARLGPGSRTVSQEKVAAPVQHAAAPSNMGVPMDVAQPPDVLGAPQAQVEEPVEPGAPAPPQPPTFDDAPLAPAYEPSAAGAQEKEPAGQADTSAPAPQPALPSQPLARTAPEPQQKPPQTEAVLMSPVSSAVKAAPPVPESPPKASTSPVQPPSAAKPKALPVFSSTGPIPFAAPAAPPVPKSPAANARQGSTTSGSPSRRGVPKSPYKHRRDMGSSGSVGIGNGVSRSMLENEEVIEEKQDIWEVPETPAK